MSTDPASSIGRQLVRAGCIVLFFSWALTEAIHLLAGVWLGLVVVGGIVAIGTGAAMWWRSRRNSW